MSCKNTLLTLLLSLSFVTITKGVETHDAIKGALLGAAMGDALGRVTEFIDTSDRIHQLYGPLGVRSFNDFKGKDWLHDSYGKKFAAYTDDTVMSLIVLEELINEINTSKCVNTHRYIGAVASRFVALFGPDKHTIDPLFDVRAHGLTNTRSCMELGRISNQNSPTWWNRKGGDIARECGCGSVMRAWPLGLVLWDMKDNEQLEVAWLQSVITHRHPMAQAASLAIATAVLSIIHFGKTITPQEIVNHAIKRAEHFDKEELTYKVHAKKVATDAHLHQGLVAKNKLLTSDMIRYAAAMAQSGSSPAQVLGTHNERQSNYRSTKGFLLGWSADEAIAAAVYIFLRHPHDMQAALAEAVNTPGDSDSIGTLVGALVGAYNGFSSFAALHDWDLLENIKMLEQLADATYACRLRVGLKPH